MLAADLPAPWNQPGKFRELLDACHANFLASTRCVVASHREHRIDESARMLVCAAASAPAEFNGLFLASSPADPEAQIQRAADLVHAAGATDWRIVAEPGAAANLGSVPESYGFRSRRELPGMWLAVPPGPSPPTPSGLTIRTPSDPAEWSEFLATGVLGFGGPRPDRPSDAFPFELSRDFRGLWGHFEGEPVATCVAFSHGGVTGVFFVTTRPEFRGRGFGTALTWQAVEVARERGDAHVFLQATEMGEPVYRRMGFREIVRYREWSR